MVVVDGHDVRAVPFRQSQADFHHLRVQEIVAVQEKDPVSRRHGHGIVPGGAHALVGLVGNPDTGVLLRETVQDFARAVLAAIVLTTWIGLNFTNIDRIVAENQVARFNRDTQSETWISVNGNDSYWTKRISALASDQYWSPDYYPVFEKIENPNAKAQALNLLKTRGNAKRNEGPAYRTPRFYDWSLSYLKIPKE